MKLEWTLQVHGSINKNGNALDLYSLRHSDATKKPIIITVEAGDIDTPKLVEAAMNGLGVAAYQPGKHWHYIFKKIFHGPWRENPLTKMKEITITEHEERELRVLIFRENAKLDLAQARGDMLEKDLKELRHMYDALSRKVVKQEQEEKEAEDTVDLFDRSVPDFPYSKEVRISPQQRSKGGV